MSKRKAVVRNTDTRKWIAELYRQMNEIDVKAKQSRSDELLLWVWEDSSGMLWVSHTKPKCRDAQWTAREMFRVGHGCLAALRIVTTAIPARYSIQPAVRMAVCE